MQHPRIVRSSRHLTTPRHICTVAQSLRLKRWFRAIGGAVQVLLHGIVLLDCSISSLLIIAIRFLPSSYAAPYFFCAFVYRNSGAGP